MKHRCLISMLLLLGSTMGCSRSVDPAFYAKFQAAQQAFERSASGEDFLRAAAMYQEILDAGVTSGAVLYNQGNAYMRAGEKGRAIACYRQAQRYRPRDPYLDANLGYALSEGELSTSRPFLQYILFWQDWISYPVKFTASIAAAIVTFLFAVGGLFLHPTLLKRAALVALAATLALTASAVYDWYRFSHLQYGVVVEDDTVARKGDSDSYQPAFTQPLREGTEFRVIDQRNGWVFVRLGASQEGWVRDERVVVY